MVESNSYIRSIVTKYISNAKETWIAPIPFLLFVWPKWLWKYDVAVEAMHLLLWEYKQDGIILKDCTYTRSDDPLKPHTIKVSEDDEIPLSDGSLYHDIGIREVNQWLARSSVWDWKVLVIEDAERMTDGAANALLKVLEEPLQRRIIIATCSHPGQILSTIYSRALIFTFNILSEHEMDVYISSDPKLHSYDKDFLLSLAGWKPGVLHDMEHKSEDMELLQDVFRSLVSGDQTWTMVWVYKKLCLLAEHWLDTILLHALQYHFATKEDWKNVRLIQDTVSLTEYSIKIEHVLFDFISAFYAANKK